MGVRACVSVCVRAHTHAQTHTRRRTHTLARALAYLVDAVAQPRELVDAGARLHVRVVPRADGAHAGGLVARVALWAGRGASVYACVCVCVCVCVRVCVSLRLRA